jgi:hypothetical protein
MEVNRVAPALCLATFLSVAAFALAAALTGLLVGDTEGTEWGLFIAAFAVLLPAAILVGVREAAVERRGPGGTATVALASGLGLTAVLVASRLVRHFGGDTAAAVTLCCLIGLWAIGILAFAGSRALHRAAELARARLGDVALAWSAAAVLPALMLVMVGPILPRPLSLIVSVAIGAALLAAYLMLRPAERFGRWAGIALDVAVVLLVLGLVDDVTVWISSSQMQPDPTLGGGTIAAGWLPVHYNLFLGPANDVLHGRVLLVDTYSNYGVGNIYFLAGFFKLAPLGYGTMGLLVAAALAVEYAVAYLTMRLAGCSRLIAAAAMAAAIVSSVFHIDGSPTLFLSLGAQRWGFGYLLILLAVLSARRQRQWIRFAMAAIVGIAAIWSVEAFAYTAATFAAIVAYEALVVAPAGERLRALVRTAAPAVAAAVAAQLALTVATLLASGGHWPDWGGYFAIVRAYGKNGVGSVLAPPWWPELAVPGFLFISALVTAALTRLRPEFEAENRPALIALAAVTAFAISGFTYVVLATSADPVLRTDLPAIIAAALWVHLAGRAGGSVPRAVRTAFAALAFWLVGVFVVKGWSDFVHRADRTPLVAALPGTGGSLRHDLSTITGNPPLDPRSVEGAALLDRYWPGQTKALVLVRADLAVETLVRAGRANLLPVPDTLMYGLALHSSEQRILPSLRAIPPGTLMLTEDFYLTPGAKRDFIVSNSGPLPLERFVLRNLRRRFRLVPVVRAPDQFVIVRLTPRSGRS